MSEKTYHSYTLKQINDKFYIDYDGTEEYFKIRGINAKLAKYWQEVSSYYTDSKRRLDRSKNELRRLEEQLDLDQSFTRAKYIKENRELGHGKKWTDEARKTLAITENMTPDVKKQFREIHNNITEWEEEVMIWHEVRQNLKYLSSRIDNDSMNNAVERKVTKNYSEDGSNAKEDNDAKSDNNLPF